MGSDFVKVGAYTDTGKVRQINEDSYYVPEDLENGVPLFVVADGMGGHNAGEIASHEAVKEVVRIITKKFETTLRDDHSLMTLVKESIRNANKKIFQQSIGDSGLDGMGTTLTVMLVCNEKMYIGHIGDSRVYVVRRGKITQLTKDHSYVEQLVNNGTITREQAAKHPHKNVITRALGIEERIEIDTHIRRLYKKDTIILCTDGLTNMVTDEQIKEVVSQSDSCDIIAEDLVKQANNAGGEDNSTVVVIEV